MVFLLHLDRGSHPSLTCRACFLPQTSIIEQKPPQTWGWAPQQPCEAQRQLCSPQPSCGGSARHSCWGYHTEGKWQQKFLLAPWLACLVPSSLNSWFVSNYLAPRASTKAAAERMPHFKPCAKGVVGKEIGGSLGPVNSLPNESCGFSGNRYDAWWVGPSSGPLLECLSWSGLTPSSRAYPKITINVSKLLLHL